jgi:DNA-binding NarL/FixJ family response regulator
MAHSARDEVDAAPWQRVIPLNRPVAAVTPAPGAPIRVFIAEAQGLVRAGLRSLLESRTDLAVIGEASTGDDAVAMARRMQPDVVLMDVGLPGLDAHEATRAILADTPPGAVRVLTLMISDSDDAMLAALRSGATGLLLKDTGLDDLVDAIRVVAAGDALLSPRIARRLVGDFLSRPERLTSTPAQLDELTPREREVVALVASGLSNDEISERLVVTRATAKTHVSRALGKLRARDRAQLVVMAYESGLVRPAPDRAEPAPLPPPVAVSRPVVPHAPRGGRWQPLAA